MATMRTANSAQGIRLGSHQTKTVYSTTSALRTTAPILPPRGLGCARNVVVHATEGNTRQGQKTALNGLEVAVPADQRPVNELKSLKQAQLYSWVG